MKKLLIILTAILILTGCGATEELEGPTKIKIGEYVFTADYLHPVKDYWESDRSNVIFTIKEVDKEAGKHELEEIAFDQIRKKCELEGNYTEEIHRSQDPKGQIDMPEGVSDLFEIISLNKGKEKFYCYFFLMHLEDDKDHLFIEILNKDIDKNELFDLLESIEKVEN